MLVFVILFLWIIVFLICNLPLFRLSSQQREKIINYGLFHYTNINCAKSIKEEGLKGSPSHMGFPETLLGELVWMYSLSNSNEIDTKHNILVKKKRAMDNPEMYNCCLHLNSINEEYLNHIYVRLSDKAIVYRGKWFKPDSIEIIKKW